MTANELKAEAKRIAEHDYHESHGPWEFPALTDDERELYRDTLVFLADNPPHGVISATEFRQFLMSILEPTWETT